MIWSVSLYAVFVTIALMWQSHRRIWPEVVLNHEVEIRNMKVGEYGWTQNWCVYAFYSTIFINGNYKASPEKKCDTLVKVVMREHGVELADWPDRVLISRSKHHWGEPIRVINAHAVPVKLKSV